MDITFKSKFEIGQDVYIIVNSHVFKSIVSAIKVKIEKPAKVESLMGRWPETLKQDIIEGITVELLVLSYEKEGLRHYNWYNQRDVFESEGELIKDVMKKA